MAFLNFYRGKTALVTGHTGFKGSWTSIWLAELGARVVGYSLEPPSRPSHFEATGLAERVEHIHGDVRDAEHLERVVRHYQPDVVFHMAAQAIVLTGFQEPRDTFSTNVMGTVNVCDVVQRHSSARALVVITSDKCYQNQEWVWGYRETDRLGGHDPYGASKACAELAIAVFQDPRFQHRASRPEIPISSVRAGNVIGGGDWAADRLIPDIVRAIAAGEVVQLRSPNATRPWQHVLEAVSGYLWLAAKMALEGARYQSAYNFGPALSARGVPVIEIAQSLLANWGPTRASIFAGVDRSGAESGLLRLDVSRAEAELDWRTTWTVEETLVKTAAWYRAYYSSPRPDLHAVSVQQIGEYLADAKERHLAWAAS
jgi:CDP-glucose 4,6-dehydratase